VEDTVTNTAAETQVAPQNTTTEQAAPQATTTTTETAAGTVDTETTATPESTSAAPTETSTEEQGSETATPQAVAPAPKKSIEDILKENGYEEELQVLQNAKQQKQKEAEEAEKPFSETKEWAALIDFSAKNKLANADDFIEHKKINAESNQTLAFEKFKSEFVAPEGSEELEASELNELITEQFNEKFFINSENEALKKIGEKELESFANEVRKPINEKIAVAQNRFATTAMYQQHQKALTEFNKNPQTITTKFKDDAGNEIELSVDITPTLEQAEVDTYLKSEEASPVLKMIFESFTKDREQGDKGYGAVLSYLHQQKSKDIISQKIAEKAYEKGLEKAKGLAAGAKKPFNSKENATPETTSEEKPLRQYSGGKFA